VRATAMGSDRHVRGDRGSAGLQVTPASTVDPTELACVAASLVLPSTDGGTFGRVPGAECEWKNE
jgi:hypothetical protein